MSYQCCTPLKCHYTDKLCLQPKTDTPSCLIQLQWSCILAGLIVAAPNGEAGKHDGLLCVGRGIQGIWQLWRKLFFKRQNKNSRSWLGLFCFWVAARPLCSVTDSDLPVEEVKCKKIWSFLSHWSINMFPSLCTEQSKPLLCGFCQDHCDCLHKFIERWG